MLWYSNRTVQYQHIPRRQGKGRAPLSHQTNHDHHGSPGSNMKVSEAELKQLEANVRQLELHVMQEIELQSAESVSRDAHVQYLMRELGRLANAGMGDERVEEREKQLQQIKWAKEILDHAFGVATTIHEVPNEIDQVKKIRDSQELETAWADLAEKEERERGSTSQWRFWFLVWVGIAGAAMIIIMAGVAA